MKKDRQKVKMLRDHVLGLRMDLDLIVNDLSIINTDLIYLEKIESDLLANIRLLKQEKVIAMASQYRKSILELESVKKNISHYKIAKRQLDKRYEVRSSMYKLAFEDYEKRRKKLEETRVILLFDTKKRRNKKK